MNKIISILITLLLFIVFVTGCSDSANSNNDVGNSNDIQQVQENKPAEQNSNEAIQPEDQDTNQENESSQIQKGTKSESNDETIEAVQFKYSVDTEYSIDLNKDGQPDTIVYSNNLDEIYMTINGVSHELSEHDPGMTYNKFMAVDIDAGDKSVEIVLNEADPPFGDCLTFYRYDGENIFSFGSVMMGWLDDYQNGIIFDGHGEFSVLNNSRIMQEGIYYKKYIISETGSIEDVPPQKIYTYTTPITSKVNKEIRGYNDKTTDQSYFQIPAGDEIVIYGEIDNWLNIKWKNNELWINDDELTHFSSDPEYKFEFDGIQFWS